MMDDATFSGATLVPAIADPVEAPLAALAAGGVLAVVTGVTGPHYRDPGALMALPRAAAGGLGAAVGSLSSGCIEGDIARHAAQVWDAPSGAGGRRLLYGTGSPFIDLVLPCGGGMEVGLVAVRDPHPIARVLAARAARLPARLGIDVEAGRIGEDVAGFVLDLPPPVRLLVRGAGAEALAFCSLARALGAPVSLGTHDAATAAAAIAAGIPCRSEEEAASEQPDRWSAVVLFYHDHERETQILAPALASPAFWIGAQGSRRTHQRRVAALQDAGLDATAIARLRGPIGVVPSARDPRLLALSVLAEIMGEAAQRLRPSPCASPA